MDVVKLEDFCHLNLGNVTFAVRCARASLAVVWRSWAGDVLTACAPPLQEAYQKTGRIINIFLTHTPHKGYPSLLNHLVSLALSPGPCCIFALDLFLFWSNALSPSAAPPLQTTPNVLLYSAAAAACAQPGMYEPVELVAKDIDGKIVPLLPAQGASAKSWSSKTVHYSLPMARLSELFNVNHFIVSQVNPHVVPFLRSLHSNSRFSLGHRFAMMLGSEVIHRVKQAAELGYWPRCVGSGGAVL